MILYNKKICIDITGDIESPLYVVSDVIDRRPLPMLCEAYPSLDEAVADIKSHKEEVMSYLETKDYTLREKNGDEVTEKHPAYCSIGFHKSFYGAGGTSLFNSAIKHMDTITLTIQEAEMSRHLHKDWLHPRKTIIEVELSNSQFVDLITHMNQGEGVGATIRRREGRGIIPHPDFVSKQQQFSDEFAEKAKKTCGSITALEEELSALLEKKKIPKKDKETIDAILLKLRHDNGTNMAFLETSWQEQLDKTTTEAKQEIEAFWDRKLHNIAVEAIKQSGAVEKLSELSNPVIADEI